MIEIAGSHGLLLRLAYNAGMRKMEYAHAERTDVNPVNKTIRVLSPIGISGTPRFVLRFHPYFGLGA